jgi:hypothetical protein
VVRLLAQVRRWWAARPRPDPSQPFRVACVCGHIVAGLRRQRYQVVPCPSCGNKVFILGYSPIPSSRSRPTPSAPVRHWWLAPTVAGVVTLALVVAVFLVLFSWLNPSAAPQRANTEREALPHALAAGRRALVEEKYQIAVREFDRARKLRDEHPEALSPAESADLDRLYRESALLADLLSESLGEILQRAAGMREDEWKAQFLARYQNRAVIFDDRVQRDPAGVPHLTTYEVRAPGEPAVVSLEQLTVLKGLPLDRPQRLLFGARLRSVAREGAGLWVIRFAPESGVLLTDEIAAQNCFPQPLDEELKSVLKRQAEWSR